MTTNRTTATARTVRFTYNCGGFKFNTWAAARRWQLACQADPMDGARHHIWKIKESA